MEYFISVPGNTRAELAEKAIGFSFSAEDNVFVLKLEPVPGVPRGERSLRVRFDKEIANEKLALLSSDE